MKNIDLDECHRLLLQIATTFADICERHHIPYYMLGGTMMGAIRHQGFIPWDDDMDFGVERPYFDQLIQALTDELPEHLKIRTIDNSAYVFSNYFKIEDIRTEVVDYWHDNVTEMGICIDVFPIDKGMKNRFSTKALASFVFFFLQINVFLLIDPKYRKGYKRYVAMLLRKVNSSSLQKRIHYIDRIIKKYSADTSKFMVNFYGRYKLKEIIPASFFGKPQPYPFENTTLTGVEKVDDYLSLLYGNYRQLPPEDKRTNHTIRRSYK